MNQVVSYGREGRVGVITVDNPPVNALSVAVRQGLLDALDAALADEDAAVVLLICAGRTFVAGADISEFDKPPLDPNLNAVIDRFEQASKPVVAALHGTALGGGLELAMGCHYRCAIPGARMGQPEVKLGIIPGAGGTQRLPRLIGVERALALIVTGDPVSAADAHRDGLVDAILDGELREAALAYAEGLAEAGKPPRRTCDMTPAAPTSSAGVYDHAHQLAAKRMRGQTAPVRAIECVEAAVTLPFRDGLALEQNVFTECLHSQESAALRHVFFAERDAGKVPDLPAGTAPRVINRAAIVGLGTMGGGIAMAFANAGIPVHVLEESQERLESGMNTIRSNYAASVSRGRMTQSQLDERLARIIPVLDYEDFETADLVIEAVFEDMEIKKDVFRRLDTMCKPDAILATNTSTLDVNEIAAVTARPESVVGLHFFSPANVMRLLEIVRGTRTSHETLATALTLAKALKKIGVVVGVCDGFVGNRMVLPYFREAEHLLLEGALPRQVDAALEAFGFAMGPFAVNDLAGLDIGWRIRKRQAATRVLNPQDATISDQLCEMGRFGQKTGAGYYRYDAGNRKPIPDPDVETMVREASERFGLKRRDIPDDEIVARCVFALVNEGAHILDEGIAQRAGDIDIIYIYGYGFPAYRGGPMFYADSVGLGAVHARICEWRESLGTLWTPAPLLERLAKAGDRFNRR